MTNLQAIIPLRGDKYRNGDGTSGKSPLVKWSKFQNEKPTEKEIQTWKKKWPGCAWGILTGTPNGLIVLDIDDDKIPHFLEEYIRGSMVVKTKRGFHIYFQLNEAEEIKSKTVEIAGVKVEVKGNGSYVVAPGSVVNGHEYRIIQGGWESIQPLPPELLSVLRGVSPIEIIDIIRPYYVEGQRQDLVMALAGFLYKNGWKKEDVINLVRKLISETGDKEVTQRIAAVEYTYQKKPDAVLGISLLRYILSNEDLEKLKEVIGSGNTLELAFGKFKIEDDIVYLCKVKKDTVEETTVGPAVFLERMKLYENTTAYEIRFRSRKFTLHEIDVRDIERKTGMPVPDVRRFKDFLLLQAIKGNVPAVEVVKKTGWGKKFKTFYHPDISPSILFEHPDAKRFVCISPEKQHQFIYKALKEGKLLGILYLLSISALFVRPTEGNPYVVYICGPSKAGKTTSAKLATAVFYDSSYPPTTNMTSVGVELYLSSYTDLSVLLDEESLKGFSDEKLVFSISTGRGKVRGTKNLQIKFTEINACVFITSEVGVVDSFSRVGAHRRMFYFPVSSWEDFSEKISIEEALSKISYCGAGVDYIRYLIENPSLLAPAEGMMVEGMEQILKPVWSCLAFLEKYYQTEFNALRASFENYLIQRKEELASKSNPLERFSEELMQYLARNSDKVLLSNDEIQKKKNIVARVNIEEDGTTEVFILTSVFNEFCLEKGFERTVYLNILEKEGWLIPSVEGKRKRKRLYPGSPLVSVYHIVIPGNEVRRGFDPF